MEAVKRQQEWSQASEKETEAATAANKQNKEKDGRKSVIR